MIMPATQAAATGFINAMQFIAFPVKGLMITRRARPSLIRHKTLT